MQPTYEQLFLQNQALIQENQALKLQLQEALTEIRALKEEIRDLKDKLNSDSSNSSKPPSQLAQPFEDVKEHTLNQAHLNADETSWKTLTEKRWMWTGCSSDSVFFEIKARRTTLAFQEVFGSFKGGLTTDRYNAYNLHEGDRQLCWSHADRDFKKISTRDGFDKLVGEQLLECKSVVFTLWHSFKSGQITRGELINQIENGPKKDLKLWLKAGMAHEDTQAKTKATCGDFFDKFDMLWIFIYRENVEPTNNAAERNLRFGVIWRKLSYGSQSEIGERFVERVMSIAMTLKLRAKNTFEYFTECFRAFIRGGQSPPIFSTTE